MIDLTFPLPSKYDLSVTKEIDKIAEPLIKQFDLTFFSVLRLHWDLKVYHLFNRYDVIELAKKYQWEINHQGLPLPIGKEFFFDHDIDVNSPAYQNVILPLKRELNIHHLSAFIVYHTGVTCLYFFGTHEKNDNLSAELLRNSDLLKQFSYYFTQKARPILKQAYKHAGKVKIQPNFMPRLKNEYKSEFSKSKALRNSFTPPKRYYLDGKYEDCYLTRKELASIILLSQGFTFSEIGRKIGISERTAYDHVMHVKDKLNCRSRIDLINKLQKLQIMPNFEKQLQEQDDINLFKQKTEKWLNELQKSNPNLSDFTEELRQAFIDKEIVID